MLRMPRNDCYFRPRAGDENVARAFLAALRVLAVLFACHAPASQAQDQGMGGSAGTSWWDGSPWDSPERGFNWYPDPVMPAAEPEKKPGEKPKTIYGMSSLEEIKKELDRIKSLAVINPTEANVLEFLRAQNWVMDKSSVFADVSRRVVWANPEVNYAARSPTLTFARSLAKERADAQRRENALRLAQTHAILFFARSDCDFCHDQASILRAFSKETGMQVLAVTMDGGAIPMFPDAKPDNGISLLASGGNGIATVPMLFLIGRESQQTLPLGSGVVAGEELAERIRVLTLTSPGQEF